MTNESAFSLYVSAGIALAVVVGFLFPPLTTPGAKYDDTIGHNSRVKNELSHCLNNLTDLDCACFARTAGHILSYEGPEVRGFVYADRSDLARDQAGSSC